MLRRHGLCLVICSAALATPVLAQDEAGPISPAPGSPQQVRDAESILPRVGTNQSPVMPTRPAESNPVQPGLTGGQDWLRVLNETLETEVAPSTLAEGAYVLGRVGDLIAGPSGLLIFVPEEETRKPGEGPVLLMPSRALGQLEREWTTQRVRVSGEIFTYHGRNQLLLSSYQLIALPMPETDQKPDDASSPAKPTANTNAGEEPATDAPSLEDDPAVRDLLNELEQELAPEQAATDESIHELLDSAQSQTVLPRAPVTVNEHDASGLEEGTLIMRRPSRMIRNAQGAWSLVFDNDIEPVKAAIEPSATELIVLPCQTLMRMETVAMESGDVAQLLVSGRVYTYQGNAYIMPTLVQRVRPSEINSLQ